MSTLKNLLFLSCYRCRLGEYDVLAMYSMFISLIYLALASITTPGYYLSLFSFVPLVIILIVLNLMSYLIRNGEDNYLISIFKAKKLRKKIINNEKMTGEIWAKLSVLIAETLSKKDPKDLNAWINNFQAWEKYQRDLVHKKYLLAVLPNEVSEIEKNVKTLWDGLMW